MSEDERQLLAVILDSRDEDVPRLVYADWLEENGQRERAEFIRVQVELAQVNPAIVEMVEAVPGRNWEATAYARVAELRRRVQDLWLCEGPQGPLNMPWIPGLSRPLLHQYSRGFVSALTCTWEDWRTHADAILKAQPIEKVVLTTRPENINEAALYSGPDDNGKWKSYRWPGIEFELPPSEALFMSQVNDPTNFDYT